MQLLRGITVKITFYYRKVDLEIEKEYQIYVNSKIKVKNLPLNDFFLNDFNIFNLNLLSCRGNNWYPNQIILV